MRSIQFVLVLMAFLLSGKLAQSEWIELEGAEREALYGVVLAAQEAHWKNSQRGWCRAHIDDRSITERILEIELSWSDSRVGVQVRDATEHVLHGKPVEEITEVNTYGSRECWFYSPHHAVNSMTGFGGKDLRKIRGQYDCRPRQMWLSILGGQAPEMSHLNLIRKQESCKLYRSENPPRIQIRTSTMVFEFAADQDYSPVLFECHMNHKGLPKNGKRPIRETYKVARDSHGVWYCKSVELTMWVEGLDQKPKTGILATIVEYDSDPPSERMRLDYKTIGANSETKVSSYVPGHTGSWKYGKGTPGDASQEEKALRQASERMQDRGFSKEKPGDQKAGQP